MIVAIAGARLAVPLQFIGVMSDSKENIIEYELKEIDTVSTFKMVFLISIAVGCVVALVQIVAFAAAGNWEWIGGSLILLPVIAILQGAIILMLAWLYNVFAGRFGGIRMRWKPVPAKAPLYGGQPDAPSVPSPAP